MKGFFDDIADLIRKNGRVEELRQLARATGFKFKNKESFSVQDYLLKSFSVFKGKKDKRIKGVLQKEVLPTEAQVRIYDFIYFGDMKTRKTTIFEIHCEAMNLPRFEIHPKGFFTKVSDIFLEKEKPYADDAEFHGKYVIQTQNREGFEDAIGPKVLDFVLDKNNVSMEGEDDFLLLYFPNKLTPANYIMEEYEQVLDLLDIILNDDSNEYV